MMPERRAYLAFVGANGILLMFSLAGPMLILILALNMSEVTHQIFTQGQALRREGLDVPLSWREWSLAFAVLVGILVLVNGLRLVHMRGSATEDIDPEVRAFLRRLDPGFRALRLRGVAHSEKKSEIGGRTLSLSMGTQSAIYGACGRMPEDADKQATQAQDLELAKFDCFHELFHYLTWDSRATASLDTVILINATIAAFFVTIVFPVVLPNQVLIWGLPGLIVAWLVCSWFLNRLLRQFLAFWELEADRYAAGRVQLTPTLLKRLFGAPQAGDHSLSNELRFHPSPQERRAYVAAAPRHGSQRPFWGWIAVLLLWLVLSHGSLPFSIVHDSALEVLFGGLNLLMLPVLYAGGSGLGRLFAHAPGRRLRWGAPTAVVLLAVASLLVPAQFVLPGTALDLPLAVLFVPGCLLLCRELLLGAGEPEQESGQNDMTSADWTRWFLTPFDALARLCFLLGRFYAVFVFAILLLSTIASAVSGSWSPSGNPVLLLLNLYLFVSFAVSIWWPREVFSLLAESLGSTLFIMMTTMTVALAGAWIEVRGAELGEAEQLLAAGEVLRQDLDQLVTDPEVFYSALGAVIGLFSATFLIAIFFYLMRAYAIVRLLPKEK